MNKGKKAFMYIFLSIVSFLSVFPLYYMFCASTNKSVDVIAGKLIPGTYLIENFKTLIANQNLGLALWNSFRNATVLTILCLLVCSIAGYGFEIYVPDVFSDGNGQYYGGIYASVYCYSIYDYDVPTGISFLPS